MSEQTIELNFEGYSYTSIPCLQWLWGSKFDEITKAWISGLRPSSVRVSKGCIHCDARRWRVTVLLNEDDSIAEITQEVEVGLPDGIEDGHDLKCKSIPRPEPIWKKEPSKLINVIVNGKMVSSKPLLDYQDIVELAGRKVERGVNYSVAFSQYDIINSFYFSGIIYLGSPPIEFKTGTIFNCFLTGNA